ncbi:gluconate 2-dehydrogenase subunit 3 family protein [Tunturiibacter gelidiferens]|uniref:gluconate 2-dehydrogenase subunit 3 family protein n=1 Tax=Tunturiibacter gelidiferens TaxID=3069689 RepID=UPI003D9BA16B
MQSPKQQESRIVAINTEQVTVAPSRRITAPSPTIWLKRLIDSGTLYIPQNLNPTQFATLQAITLLLSHPFSQYTASRIDASMVTSISRFEPDAPLPPVTFDYRLGLDELETITRTRTGYSFTELHTDLQDAILSLVASRDLTSRKLDLACWLEDLQTHTLALAA